MNREDTKKAAEVMLAFAAGEEIEIKYGPAGYWHACSEPDWNWGENDYRVKPKAPRTFFAVDYSEQERCGAYYIGPMYDTPEAAKAAMVYPNGRVIELQEVVK